MTFLPVFQYQISQMPNTKYQIPNIKVKGFTLIEALVFLFLFAVVSTAFFEAYAVGTRLIIESKNRLGATALANQKMEIIRSIDYDNIGTKHWNGSAWVYGIPAGDLLEDETVSVNTRQYAVHTFVQYADDSFDGTLGGTPNDTIPNDYKRIRISVAWGSGGADQTVTVFANVSPNGIETSAGGGVLSINILDTSGSGISGVTVHLVNGTAGVDLTTQTDATGNITLPATPASNPAGAQDYALTVSKSGYYGTVTYPPYPTSAFDPIDEHVSVNAGALNPITITIDQASDILLHTKDPFGTAVPNITTHVVGGRILGADPTTNPPTPVYGFSQDTDTNASGDKTFAGESSGQYAFSITDTQYEFYKFSPEETARDIFEVIAGAEKNSTAILLDKQIGSVKAVITNQADASPIAGADVHLSHATLPYDATVATDQYGYAYFPTAMPELLPETYDIAVSATGFGNYTGTVTVSGALVDKNIPLTPN